MMASEEKPAGAAMMAEAAPQHNEHVADLSADSSELPKGYYTSSLFIGTYLVSSRLWRVRCRYQVDQISRPVV